MRYLLCLTLLLAACGQRATKEDAIVSMQLMDRNGETIPGDLYGKVVDSLSENPAGFSVRFTSIPQGIKAFLQSLLA